jgi:hypothetical protein
MDDQSDADRIGVSRGPEREIHLGIAARIAAARLLFDRPPMLRNDVAVGVDDRHVQGGSATVRTEQAVEHIALTGCDGEIARSTRIRIDDLDAFDVAGDGCKTGMSAR